MDIYLDNAQSTPHINIIGDDGFIKLQISFCKDDILINDRSLNDYPKADNILLLDEDGYSIVWSKEDGEYVGLCTKFPSLSWLAKTQEDALKGINRIVKQVSEATKDETGSSKNT